MRIDDINCARQVTSSHCTASMYVPRNTKMEDMQPDILKRALCQKNIMKDWRVCKACQSGCRAGNLLVSHMTKEPPRQQPVRTAPPKKKKTGRKPSETIQARLTSARDAILQGSGRDEAARLYGYKNWDTLRDAMTRLGIEPPPPTGKDKAKRMDYEKERREESIQKCMHARRLFAEGMKREDAARAVGHSCWQVVQNTYYRHRAEVDRRESL